MIALPHSSSSPPRASAASEYPVRLTTHIWTPPVCQEAFCGCHGGQDCTNLSGLQRAYGARALRELRPRAPHERSGLSRPGALSGAASVGLTWVPASHSAPQSQVGAPCSREDAPALGGPPVLLAPRAQRPDDAGVLGRERHRRTIVPLPVLQRLCPAALGLRAVACARPYPAGPVEQPRAARPIASLPAVAPTRLTAAGIWPGDKSQPSRHLPTLLAPWPLPNRRHKGGGRRGPPTFARHQALSRFTLVHPPGEPAVGGGKPLLQGPEPFRYLGAPCLGTDWEPIRGVVQDPGQHAPETRQALRDHAAICRQSATNRLRQRRAVFHQQFSSPLARQHGLWGHRFPRHNAHGWAGHRLAARCRIGPVVRRLLTVGPHTLGSDAPHCVAELPQRVCPLMGTCPGVHPEEAGRELGKDASPVAAGEPLVDPDLSRASHPMPLHHRLGHITTNTGPLQGRSPSCDHWRLTRCPCGIAAPL
jgi:hypothetical protein